MAERTVAVITGKGEVVAVREKIPTLKEGEVLIRVHASLISPGTEMSSVAKLRQEPDPNRKTAPFGYANAGEIMEINGPARDLKVGMRVAAMGTNGAFHTNYACVPVNMIVPIPDNVSYEQAAYACLGATALQAVRRTEPQLGEYGLVLGLGIVGNLAAQLYQLSGSRVFAWEGLSNRVRIARRCRIGNIAVLKKDDVVEKAREFAAPYGMDFALFAFGGEATPAWEQVKRCMKVSADTHAMGRVVLVGGCKVTVGGGAASGNLDVRAASRTGAGYKDLDYEYGRTEYPAALVPFTTQRNLREIIQLIAEKRLIVDPMTTHRLPLEEIGSAADLLINTPNKAMGMIMEMKH